MGEALTLDGIANSIDAEVIAKGTSGKGPERGAIVRHGPYTLWAFEGPVSDMTAAGKTLFVNTVFYAAKHATSCVLENKLNQTRDGPFRYVALARGKIPGLLRTLSRNYLPERMAGMSLEATERWLVENRPYLMAQGRRFEVDGFAKQLSIPNHRRGFLERCIAELREAKGVRNSVARLVRYTGRADLGSSADAWQKWYGANKPYVFFSDSEGFQFKIDEEAKARGIPVEELRGWSSEKIDYRANPACSKLKKRDAQWFVLEFARLRRAKSYQQANALHDAVGLITAFTAYPRWDLFLHEVYKQLTDLGPAPQPLLASLESDDPVRRIISVAVLAGRCRLPLDFAYDALEQDPTVTSRAAAALRGSRSTRTD